MEEIRPCQSLACDLDGEVAILNLKTSLYLGLDKVGAVVLGAVANPGGPRKCGVKKKAMCREDIPDTLDDLIAERAFKPLARWAAVASGEASAITGRTLGQCSTSIWTI